MKEVKSYSDALASGLLELGLKKNSTIVSILPATYAELHTLQLACSRGGFILHSLPEGMTDPKVIGRVLKETKASAIFTVDATEKTSYITLLQSIIEELDTYDERKGLLLESETFPELKYCVHTGFDIIRGFTCFKHIMAFNGEPDEPKHDEDGPIFQEYDMNGKKVGSVLNQLEVREKWEVVGAIVEKKYIEA